MFLGKDLSCHLLEDLVVTVWIVPYRYQELWASLTTSAWICFLDVFNFKVMNRALLTISYTSTLYLSTGSTPYIYSNGKDLALPLFW